ncbi:hypothetical protein [Phaeocystidibacter luteus]|uniref:Uncharacterized protein n=1 Tax=Phaeocystidibacter luteus TaxID=911197 RepID=A0A6N6RKU3_9FLAO|nr:hypothetical protein [Phaeocystidibacter luteus]KAB2809793.1 hypothetical protein F8C67_09560 [Phaeocystidibacter luteus]
MNNRIKDFATRLTKMALYGCKCLILVGALVSCSHEEPTLSYVKAGQFAGMDVHQLNDTIPWDSEYKIHTFPYEGHDFKIEVTSPLNSPGSSVPERIRIWGEGGLELCSEEIDYGLGLDTVLGSTFTLAGSTWVGSIFYNYRCNSSNPIGRTQHFYAYGHGDTIDLNRDWNQPKKFDLLHLSSGSNAPYGVDTSRPDTSLYIHYSWGIPSCGNGILYTTEGYFMIKVTRGEDVYLGWIKYGFKRDNWQYAWPNSHILYLDSWAISSNPIHQ